MTRLTNTDLILMITISLLIKCIRMKEMTLDHERSPQIGAEHQNMHYDVSKMIKEFQFKLVLGLFTIALIGAIISEFLKVMRIAVSVIGRNVIVFIFASIASMFLMVLLPTKFILENLVIYIIRIIIIFVKNVIKQDRVHSHMWRRHLNNNDQDTTGSHYRDHRDHTHLI